MSLSPPSGEEEEEGEQEEQEEQEQEEQEERGRAHAWRGYACSLTPERLLLPRPVLQAALGTRHGLLLLEGEGGG